MVKGVFIGGFNYWMVLGVMQSDIVQRETRINTNKSSVCNIGVVADLPDLGFEEIEQQGASFA